MSLGNPAKKAEIVSEANLRLSVSLMAFTFHTYLEARNKYCFSYNGSYPEFVWQTLQVIKFAEKQFEGIKIFISCSPKIAQQINHPRIINADDFRKNSFLKIEEITFDMVSNPILKIIKESEIKINQPRQISKNDNYHIIHKTNPPFKSLSDKELNKLNSYVSGVETPINEAETLYAVECEELYKWAYLNKRTILLKKDNNEEVYKKLFPSHEILDVNNI